MRPYPVAPIRLSARNSTDSSVARLSGPPPLPRPLDLHGKSKLRAAAYRARNVYTGPVGELVSRELLSWDEFGYALAHDGLTNRLADHVLKASP